MTTLSALIDGAASPPTAAQLLAIATRLRTEQVGALPESASPITYRANPELGGFDGHTVDGPTAAKTALDTAGGLGLILVSATSDSTVTLTTTDLATLAGKQPESNGWFQDLRDRYEDLLTEYGSIAIGVYFAIFFASIAAFYTAIEFGVDIGGSYAGAGKIGAAWAATKVLQPVRILATLVLTPVVAKVKHRFFPVASE